MRYEIKKTFLDRVFTLSYIQIQSLLEVANRISTYEKWLFKTNLGRNTKKIKSPFLKLVKVVKRETKVIYETIITKRKI